MRKLRVLKRSEYVHFTLGGCNYRSFRDSHPETVKDTEQLIGILKLLDNENFNDNGIEYEPIGVILKKKIQK